MTNDLTAISHGNDKGNRRAYQFYLASSPSREKSRNVLSWMPKGAVPKTKLQLEPVIYRNVKLLYEPELIQAGTQKNCNKNNAENTDTKITCTASPVVQFSNLNSLPLVFVAATGPARDPRLFIPFVYKRACTYGASQ